MYSIQQVCQVVGGRFLQLAEDTSVSSIVFDSRKNFSAEDSLFLALKGTHRDGHVFIYDLYKKGMRNFIVNQYVRMDDLPRANVIRVDDTLQALHQLTAWHRSQFQIPVIGITGSNGKTIVKEWIYQLLHEDLDIARSPKSYNSQLGVPLSLWQINQHHQLAIIEAGISMPGEMELLEKIIKPTIGVFTNIGDAHAEGFRSRQHKLEEKWRLFRQCKTLVYCKDVVEPYLQPSVLAPEMNYITWSRGNSSATIYIRDIHKNPESATIYAQLPSGPASITIPFADDASIDNAVTCWCILMLVGIDHETIQQRMSKLVPVNMRLELKKGINHCTVINDAYSADVSSLEIALGFLQQTSGDTNKTIILSDILEAGSDDKKLFDAVAGMIHRHYVNRVIGIGERISNHLPHALSSSIRQEYYPNTEFYLQHFRSSMFREETILVKGARKFGFEQIVQQLEEKVHQTVLEIDLNSLVNNLKQYQQTIAPNTMTMAMVKAFSYGSGGAEIASTLQYHKTDYLGVAYADEGVALRKAGISLPIMVMNPEAVTFDALTNFDLEPELYSIEILHQFDDYLKGIGVTQYPVHLEIETGMNRLGFSKTEIPLIVERLMNTDTLRIRSVFSHLVASEDREQDKFSMQQFKIFQECTQELRLGIGYDFIKHISNSAAVSRHPKMQLDMVRLGIGLYGVDYGEGKMKLQPVATLKTTIAQLKNVRAGESVGYNRSQVAKTDCMIATVRIGYADGYPRRLGNGKGKMLINGKPAPVFGTVCMDMTMLDVTNIPGVKVGDPVIVFGKGLPVQDIASAAETIPYEIMTGISQRVKRVYYEE